MKEIWKNIDGYEEIYQVSNLGRVKRLKKKNIDVRAKSYIDEHILKNRKNNYGYLEVILHTNGKGHPKKVHRLVAETFIPNPDNKPQVNHKDYNTTNNHVNNLEWVTHSENIKHSWMNPNRKKSTRYAGCNRGH